MKVGIAGIGKMGSAMGSRLLSLGHDLTVWNRTAARAQPLLDAGAQWAPSPKSLTESVDVVITLLTNEAALDDVYGAENGLLAGDVQHKTFIDMSTVRPAKPQEMALRVQAWAPVFWSVRLAGAWDRPKRASCWDLWAATRMTCTRCGLCWMSFAVAWSMWGRMAPAPP